MTTTDLTTMARFLVLPGAQELLEAFASIPPGALRQSVIGHAQVIAQTYAGAPAEMQMPDPLLTAAQATAPPIALPKPAKAARTPKTTEEAIVAQRMAGKHPADISRALSTPRLKVDAVLAEARTAGVKFPPSKGNSADKVPKQFVTSMDNLDARGAGVMRNAAKRRKMTLDAYMTARRQFVELRAKSTPMDEIAATIGMDEDTCWTWLYVARKAGLDLPTRLDFDDAEFEPKAPDATVVPIRPKPAKITSLQPGQRVFGTFEEMNGGAQHRLVRAAQARSLTIGAYMDLRESVVRQRMASVPIPEIVARTGQTYNMVKDTLAIAADRGVVFPPATLLPRPRKASHG